MNLTAGVLEQSEVCKRGVTDGIKLEWLCEMDRDYLTEDGRGLGDNEF